MPPGSMFEVLPRVDAELEIYHQGPDLMVFGAVSKVVHDGEVLASWDDTPRGTAGATSSIVRIAGMQQLKDYLVERKERISARPDGAVVFRDVMGKAFVARIIWRDEQDL